MKRITSVLLVAAALGAAGCGGKKSEVDTTPLTDEQKRQIKAQDQKVDEEEGRSYKPNKRR